MWLRRKVGLVVLLVVGTILVVLSPNDNLYYTQEPEKVLPGLKIDNRSAPFFGYGDLKHLSMNEFEQALQYDVVNLTMLDYNASYLIQRPAENVCNGVDMVVYVMTMANEKSYQQRQAIRRLVKDQSFGGTIIVRFFFGKLDDIRLDLIAQEYQDYNDLVYYNIVDYYRDNFIKWHSMNIWHMSYCSNVPYYLKLDDDTSVSFTRLFHWLDKDFDGKTKDLNEYFICPQMSGFRPVRDKNNERWYISHEEWPQKYWPTYCYGYFVFTTNYTIDALLRVTPETKLLHMDDVMFTGVMREKANVPVIHWSGVVPSLSQNRDCGSDGTPIRIAVHNAKSPLRWRFDYRRIERAYCNKH
ncbi:unnamed protein product [Bursaphelenchus okinawaensis]|uniref:Hexosyltransferase n=1 Tax=Bursaphelenchus okinawaensis TaxID=465554 RepID=A0A811JQK2_9BILA|nr:unnamed protein product [Bursaphelenchus okinawaensis]CAG9077464.1 unnamed protein product [Bursaphelenchus okinawaensis]